MKHTLFVNLFGAPGSGKSTGASFVFSQLKMNGIDCEYISEYAKDKCWELNKTIFESPENQFYIGAKQFYRLNCIDGKVDVCITDSPIFLNAFYNNSEFLGKEYNSVMLRLFNKFNNINFFLNRVKPYNSNGRNQTEQESNKIAEQIKKSLIENEISFLEETGDMTGYYSIFHQIKGIIKNGYENL